jgi:hypothetical protein
MVLYGHTLLRVNPDIENVGFYHFFCESLTFPKFPIKIGTGSWAESFRSALFDEQSGRAGRPLACKNLGKNILTYQK